MRCNLAKVAWLMCLAFFSSLSLAEDGITQDEIRIANVMDLTGRSKSLGLAINQGIKAAIQNESIGGRKLVFLSKDDRYIPEVSFRTSQQLIKQKVFVFLGNVGTPTAKMVLPLLASYDIPAIGFVSGSKLLRSPSNANINQNVINIRASYAQEIKVTIAAAVKNNIQPEQICAFVQDDDYGLSGIESIISTLQTYPNTETLRQSFQKILNASEGARNNLGPVGTYQRNTFISRDGYLSLKKWEEDNKKCRFIITVGTYASISRFIAYSQQLNEDWLYSAVSFTGADAFYKELSRFKVTERVLMTQVMPSGTDTSELVQKAKRDLGDKFGFVSLEGYISAKLLIYGLRQLQERSLPLTRKNLINVFQGQRFDLEGIRMDFSNDNQGMDTVTLTAIHGNEWQSIDHNPWKGWDTKANNIGNTQ